MRRALLVLGCVLLAAGAASLPLSSPVSATGFNTIVTPDVPGETGLYASLTMNDAGNAVVSYYEATPGHTLRVLVCGDPDCMTGNSIAVLDSGGDLGFWSSIDLDDDGNAVVSYYDLTNGDLKVAHCGNPACTLGNVIATPDTDGNVGEDTSLALDAAGNPVVAYYDVTNRDLKLLHCGDPDCGSGNSIVVLDAAGNVGEWSSLELDAAGNPVVAYYDATNADLKLLHCGDPDCSLGGETVVALDTAGAVGAYASLELDAKGNPVVSYLDASNADLKLLHCGDPACLAGNSIVAPDGAGFVGTHTSLTLDAAGNPAVSYHDYGTQDLRVLRCGNPACSAANSIAVPDTAGDVGRYTAIGISLDDTPVVTYWKESDLDLRVLHCAVPSCQVAPDVDNDGCTNAAEQQALPGSETSGGRRDPKRFWDFFDTPDPDAALQRNRVVDIDDIFLVVDRFASTGDSDIDPLSTPPKAGYHSAYDRTYDGPHPWDLGPPNGIIDIDEIFWVAAQFAHNCA